MDAPTAKLQCAFHPKLETNIGCEFCGLPACLDDLKLVGNRRMCKICWLWNIVPF